MIKSKKITVDKKKYLRDVLVKDFEYLADNYDSIFMYVESLDNVSYDKINQITIPEIALTDTLLKRILSLDHYYIREVVNPSLDIYQYCLDILKSIVEEEKILEENSINDPRQILHTILAGTNVGKSSFSLALSMQLYNNVKHSQNMVKAILAQKECPTSVLWQMENIANEYLELIKKHKNYNNRAAAILQEIQGLAS